MILTWLEETKTLNSSLLDGLYGALLGGVISAVISAWMTSRAERKRNQTEIALTFLEQFMAQYSDLAEVMGLLANAATLRNAVDVNKVRKFGDWCEIVSAAVLIDAADGTLLVKVGIPEQMKNFYRGAVAASAQVNEIATALPGWSNLAEYVK